MKSYIEENRIRPDILTSALYWAVVIMMIYDVISVKIFGDTGAGYFSWPMSLFFLFYMAFVLAVQKSVYVMVRLRARRSQFYNAESNMQKSMRLFLVVGILLSAVFMTTSLPIARNLFGSGRSYLQILFVAVSLIFLCPQGVIRGYLQGLGYTRPIFFSDLLIAFTSSVVGSVISGFLYSYGKKVNDLFHVDEFSAIYGASGMMIGLMVGSIVGLVQIFISLAVRKNEINEIVKNGAPKYLDSKNDVLTGYKAITFLYMTPILVCLLDNIVFIAYYSGDGKVAQAISTYGAFSGRVISLIVLATFLCSIPFIKSWNRVMARIERDEIEGARDRLRKLVHMESLLLIPVTVFMFAVADTIQTAVFGKTNSSLNGIIQLGSVMMLVLAIAVFCSWLLNHMGKSTLILINLSAGWGVHVLLLFVLFIGLKSGLMGIAVSMFSAFLTYDLLSIFMIFRMLKYRQEVMRTLCVPLISALVAGLLLFLINMGLVNVVGEILTLIIGVSIYYVVYMLLIIALRGVKIHELNKIPLGRLFVGIAAKIQRVDEFEE